MYNIETLTSANQPSMVIKFLSLVNPQYHKAPIYSMGISDGSSICIIDLRFLT